jgi:hypothetical protein
LEVEDLQAQVAMLDLGHRLSILVPPTILQVQGEVSEGLLGEAEDQEAVMVVIFIQGEPEPTEQFVLSGV